MEQLRKQIVEEVTERVAELVAEQSAEFRERHEGLAAELEMYKAITSQPRNVPVAGDLPPRPTEVDVACAADSGQAEVTVHIHGRQVRRRITPGSDPAVVWRSMCRTVSNYYG
jgi:hypothetical protein